MKALVTKNGSFVVSGLLTVLMAGGVLLSPSATMAAHAQAAGQAPEQALLQHPAHFCPRIQGLYRQTQSHGNTSP
jgi:hypothetical protein